MHKGEGFSAKSLGKSLFHYKSVWSAMVQLASSDLSAALSIKFCIRPYKPQKQNNTLGTEKSGHCREVAVSGSLTEIQPTVCLREMSIL